MLFCGTLEEEAAIRVDIFSGRISISVANRRFFLLLINCISVIPSVCKKNCTSGNMTASDVVDYDLVLAVARYNVKRP